MIAQLSKCTENHWIVHIKWVNLAIRELYLNKAVKNWEEIGLELRAYIIYLFNLKKEKQLPPNKP